MSIVGNVAPDFEMEGYFNEEFKTYRLSDYRGKWVLLLFYPLDFTFVCPTEVLNFSASSGVFSELNCQILGVSVDSAYVHKAWVDTPRNEGGLGGPLKYPLLSDLNKETARNYGILTPDGVALRGLFLIDPEGVIRHATINHLSVGRSTHETLRVLKAFQYVRENQGHVCPADWDEGKESMVANSDGMKKYLSKH